LEESREEPREAQTGAGEPGDSPTGRPPAGEPTDATGEREDEVGGRHTAGRQARSNVEQTKDDTDEGWGEPGDDDAAARFLRENRPPHWS
jgi:hypothetical protein